MKPLPLRALLAICRGIRAWWRWRVTRVVGWALVVLVVAGAICDYAATAHYHGLVRAKLASFAAAGYPSSYADSVPKPVPAAENAAPIYMKAAEILKQHPGSWPAKTPADQFAVGSYFSDANWADPAVVAQMKRFFAANRDVLALLTEASRRPHFLVQANWSDPEASVGAGFRQYEKMRDLTRFICGASIEASATGDQVEALRRLRVGFVMCRQVLRQQTGFIDQLVAYAMYGLLDRAATYVIGRGHLPMPQTREIALLLDGTDFGAPFEQSTSREAARQLWVFRSVLRRAKGFGDLRGLAEAGTAKPPAFLRILGPLYTLVARPYIYADELVYLNQMQKALDASKLPWCQARARYQRIQAALDAAPSWAIITKTLTPLVSGGARNRDETLARQDLLVTALGLQIYSQHHAGAYPATLAALKAAVPWVEVTDVFSGKSLVYRRTGATFLLYSLGLDCRDDGGTMNVWERSLTGEGPAPASRKLAEVPGVPSGDLGDLLWLPESRYRWRAPEPLNPGALLPPPALRGGNQ